VERQGIVINFVEKILNTPSVKYRKSLSGTRLPTAESPASSSSSDLSSFSPDDSGRVDGNLLEAISIDDYALSDSDEPYEELMTGNAKKVKSL